MTGHYNNRIHLINIIIVLQWFFNGILEKIAFKVSCELIGNSGVLRSFWVGYLCCDINDYQFCALLVLGMKLVLLVRVVLLI
jgi:hypothetical protein